MNLLCYVWSIYLLPCLCKAKKSLLTWDFIRLKYQWPSLTFYCLLLVLSGFVTFLLWSAETYEIWNNTAANTGLVKGHILKNSILKNIVLMRYKFLCHRKNKLPQRKDIRQKSVSVAEHETFAVSMHYKHASTLNTCYLPFHGHCCKMCHHHSWHPPSAYEPEPNPIYQSLCGH